MFIYMSALISNCLIWRIWVIFFGPRLEMDFFFCHGGVLNFVSFIMYFKTWNVRHWWSQQYGGWSFMYPLYFMAHWRESLKKLQIIKSDGLKFESLRGKLMFFFPLSPPPPHHAFRDEWIRSIFLSFVCLMLFQIISICIFSRYPFISFTALSRY